MEGVDFAEAWAKDRNEFEKTRLGAFEHPSLFANRLGFTADFNSSDLHRAKIRTDRKVSMPVRYVDNSLDPGESSDSEAEGTFWGRGPSIYEAKVPTAVGDHKTHFSGRDGNTLRARAPDN